MPCTNVPTFSKVISTKSPVFKNWGGFIANPTPEHVPVKIILPTRRVFPWLQNSMIWGMLWTKSVVEPFWRSSPFIRVCKEILWGSGTTCAEIHQQMGVKWEGAGNTDFGRSNTGTKRAEAIKALSKSHLWRWKGPNKVWVSLPFSASLDKYRIEMISGCRGPSYLADRSLPLV